MEKVQMKNKLKGLAALFVASTLAIGVGVSLTSQKFAKTEAAGTYTWTAASGIQTQFSGTTGTATLNGLGWSFTKSNSSASQYWSSPAVQIGSNGSATNLTMNATLPSTYGAEVKKITVKTASYQGKHNLSISVGGTQLVSSIATSSWTTLNNITTNEVPVGVNGDIELKWTMTSSARALYIESITIEGREASVAFGTLTSIAVKTPASKLNFRVGEAFSSEGLVLLASDDSNPVVTKEIATGFTTDYDGVIFDSSHIGTQLVSVNYIDVISGLDKTTSYNIEVESEPNYETGFESSQGFTAGSTYNNTLVARTGPSGKQWGTYYGTPSTNNAISGSQSMQMRWYTNAPTNLGYTYTDFDISGASKIDFKASSTNSLNVNVSYSTNSGSTWLGAELFTLSSVVGTYTFNVPLSAQQQNLRFKFAISLPSTNPGGTSNLYIDDVSLTEPSDPVALDSIAVTEQPTKKEYYVGDSFDSTGLVVTGYYDNETNAVIANELLSFTPEILALDTTTITVSFGGKDTQITGILVNERPTLSKIEITKNPNKMVYTQYEIFDSTGMEITATYSNGESAVVTVFETSISTLNVAGPAIPVTISHIFSDTTKSATLYVEVIELPTPKDLVSNVSTIYTMAGDSGTVLPEGTSVRSAFIGGEIDYLEDAVVQKDPTDSQARMYYAGTTNSRLELQALKFGSNSGKGNVKFTFTDEIRITKVTLFVARLTAGTTNATMQVNDSAAQNIGVSSQIDAMFSPYVFEGSFGNELILRNNTNIATYLFGIDIDYKTYEEDALSFANEVMTGVGNLAQGNCVSALDDLEEMYGNLSEWAQLEFETNPDQIFIDARGRLDYLRLWVASQSQSGSGKFNAITSDNNSLTMTIMLGVLGLTTIAGYYFLKKKKEAK